MEIDDDEAVVAMELGDHIRQILRSDVRAELAVQFIHSLGGERVVINGLNRCADLICEK